MAGIRKSFQNVRALDGVSFDVRAGEIHALVGENGAGKSTLMKVLSGVYPYPEYEGEIRFQGALRRFRSVHESAQAGIAVVYQELSLVPEMTVGENIFLGREPRHLGAIHWNILYSRATALLRELKLDIDARTQVLELGMGKQQLVEIAKALSQDARLLVLDEPTAALTESESETLFRILESLRARGIAIIYISHRLEEVFRLAQRVTVLRDGQTIATRSTEKLDEPGIIAMMVGREVSQLFPASTRTPGEVVFEARNITVKDPNIPGKYLLQNVSLAVREGEVLGIAGLMGAGRTELLETLFGSRAGKTAGEIRVAGREVDIKRPADAIAHGIGFVTEDRKRSGLVLDQTILRNMTLAALPRLSGRVMTHEEREAASGNRLFHSLRVKANSMFALAGTLSGGNQQKVVLGKWLMTNPRVLFLDEPTRGIDVGAKQEIYAEIDKLARLGLAVVMVSSELPEVLGLSDRILVLHEGRVSGEFPRANATPEALMACATGQSVPA